jgi:hypothetical protein
VPGEPGSSSLESARAGRQGIKRLTHKMATPTMANRAFCQLVVNQEIEVFIFCFFDRRLLVWLG